MSPDRGAEWTLARPRPLRGGCGALARALTPRRALEQYQPFVAPALLTEIKHLAARLPGLRVLHLSGLDAAADALSSLIPLQRSLGLECEWLVPRQAADAHAAQQASRWWPEPSANEWSAWLSLNYRAAGDLTGQWDVAVVHGPALAGVAAIVPQRSTTWLWDRPVASAGTPNARVAPYLGWHHAFAGPDASVDPLAPANAPIARVDAARTVRALGLDSERPYLCHASRWASWDGLDDVIAAYWGAKELMGDLQLALLGGPDPAGADLRLVSARAAEDGDLLILSDRPARDVAALRTLASVILRCASPAGLELDVLEAQWARRPVIVAAGGVLTDGCTGLEADGPAELTRQLVAMLADPARAAVLAGAGADSVAQGRLVVHALRDWLRTLVAIA